MNKLHVDLSWYSIDKIHIQYEIHKIYHNQLMIIHLPIRIHTCCPVSHFLPQPSEPHLAFKYVFLSRSCLVLSLLCRCSTISALLFCSPVSDKRLVSSFQIYPRLLGTLAFCSHSLAIFSNSLFRPKGYICAPGRLDFY